MKALTLTNIRRKPEVPLTRLSVYLKGKWTFADFGTPTNATETQSFYLVSYHFGLVRQGVQDPSTRSVRGKPGSYAILDRDGSLTMATPEQYETIFPRRILDTLPPSPTSEMLKNPNHITNTIRKSRNEGSNTIQVGNKTFNNTDPKGSITILPSGQQVLKPSTPPPVPGY